MANALVSTIYVYVWPSMGEVEKKNEKETYSLTILNRKQTKKQKQNKKESDKKEKLYQQEKRQIT